MGTAGELADPANPADSRDTERRAQPRNTRARGQDEGSSKQTPSKNVLKQEQQCQMKTIPFGSPIQIWQRD